MVGAEVCGGFRDLEYEVGALGSHELAPGAAGHAINDERSGGNPDPFLGVSLPDVVSSGLEDADSDPDSVRADVGKGLDAAVEVGAVLRSH